MDKAERDKNGFINQVNKLKAGENPEEKQEKIDELNGKILEKIKEFKDFKKEYIDLQEDKLYAKYEITEENGKSEKDQTIKYAFVTFKSMKGKERCVNTFSHCEALAKENPEEEKKKFLEEDYLDIYEARPPGNIQW